MMTSDPYGLINSLSPSKGDGLPKLPPIPVLMAEGFRTVLSVDTDKNNKVFMESYGEDFTLDLVGLMSKAGGSAFTARKVAEGFDIWGKSV